MKNERVFKNFSALSFDRSAASGESAPAPGDPAAAHLRPPPAKQDAAFRDLTTKSDDFREMLHQRYSAPYDVPASHRDWGINE